MPAYLVRFAGVAVYQADHPKARREISELLVHAPNPLQASAHALRTTIGCAEIAEVIEQNFVSTPVVAEVDTTEYVPAVT